MLCADRTCGESAVASVDADRAMAMRLLRETWGYSAGHDYYARHVLLCDMAFIDLDVALELAKSLGDGERHWVLADVVQALAARAPETIDRLVAMLDLIADPGSLVEATAEIALAASDSDHKLATSVLERAAASRGIDEVSVRSVFANASLAVAAGRLGRDDANTFFERAVSIADKLDQKRDDVLAASAGILALQPPFFEGLLPLIRSEGQRKRAMATGLIAMLRTQPDAAVAAYRQWFPTEGGITDTPDTLLAKRMAPILAALDAKAGIALARRLGNADDRAQALTAVASRMPMGDAANTAWMEAAAAARHARFPDASLARVGREACRDDAKLGDALLAEAVAILRDREKREQPTRPGETAFYLAARDPDGARAIT